MVDKSIASISRRKDDTYFLYLPKELVEYTGFPFHLGSSVRVMVSFTKEKKVNHRRIEGGFGDPDESGIRQALNAINNFTKEFNRVILISHVPVIKKLSKAHTIDV